MSQRNLLRQETRSEHDLLSNVIDMVGALVIVLDADGRFVRFNESCETTTGYTFEEVKGRSFWDVAVSPDHVEKAKETFSNLLGDLSPRALEVCWVNKRGSRRLIAWETRLLSDDHGNVKYVVGTGRDITVSRMTEDSLRESHDLLQAVFESTTEAIFVKDSEGRYLTVNPAFARFLGKPVQEIVGKRDMELYPAETARGFINDDRQVLQSGETQTFEGVASAPGITQTYLVTKGVFRDQEGKIAGLIGISHDITERKRAEEHRVEFIREQQARIDAEEANRLKDEFLTVLSHELRTPLTSILGWSQLLNNEVLDDVLRERAIAAIERNAKAQRQLIDDLLDISRIVAGKLRLDVHPMELTLLVEESVSAMRPVAEEKRIDLKSDASSVPYAVNADSHRMQQILWNLLSNALKFTPAGGTVEVALRSVDGHARIEVKDSGRGISEDFLPYVFDRFRQADSTTTRSHGGLGLGLALVRYLVELHGGSVTVASSGIGTGASFVVTLPLLTSTSEGIGDEIVTGRVEIEKRPAGIAGLRVLIVDDDPDTCEMITVMLGDKGVEVRSAASAKAGFDLLSSWKPDLMISDIGMPGEDGYDLIRRVRELEPEEGGTIPAIALTAYARVEDRDRALACGFQLHVPKPIDQIELVKAIANVSGRSS